MRSGDNPAIPAERWIAILKYRGLDTEALLAAQRRNMQALMQASDVVAKGMEELASRQTDMLREAMGRLGDAMPDPRSQHSIKEAARQQLDYSNVAVQTSLSNFQELSELVWQRNRQAYDLINRSLLDSLQSFMNGVANGQPAMPPAAPDAVAPDAGAPKKTDGR